MLLIISRYLFLTSFAHIIFLLCPVQNFDFSLEHRPSFFRFLIRIELFENRPRAAENFFRGFFCQRVFRKGPLLEILGPNFLPLY